MKKVVFAMTALVVLLSAANYAAAKDGNSGKTPEEILGRYLYFDQNLSDPPGQACASCHDPAAGFADPDSAIPVSEGAISGRFGTRNSPTSAYAAYSPDFYFDDGEGLWIGGQFWDGRAKNLEEQAMGPFLNPVEMNNTEEGVVEAVRASTYAGLFTAVYGPRSLDNVATAYQQVAQAIAAFERTRELNRFTSKYDYYLKGMVSLTEQEMRGLQLFEDPAKGNCAACHPSTSPDGVTPPLFTDFTYDNLGIPKNLEIEALKGGPVPVDNGLGVTVNDPNENGKFKVSSLRNIAKTAPYGHNGYFKTLKEIVHFYNTRDVDPVWAAPEVPATVNSDELGDLGLTSQEEDDIVAFLLTLTDGYTCRHCK